MFAQQLLNDDRVILIFFMCTTIYMTGAHFYYRILQEIAIRTSTNLHDTTNVELEFLVIYYEIRQTIIGIVAFITKSH